MKKLAASVNTKFQDWTDQLALAYHGVQSVLEKRFTCDENGRLPCEKILVIGDLLDLIDVSLAQKIPDLIKY